MKKEEDTVLPTIRNRVSEGREVGVMEMVGPMMGHSGEKRYEVVKTQMQRVRRLNRGGLVPYSYSMTSQLVIAGRRAVSMWVWKRGRLPGRNADFRTTTYQGRPSGLFSETFLARRRLDRMHKQLPNRLSVRKA